LRRIVFTLILTLFLPAAARAQVFHLKVIALNDLHGNLQSPGAYAANAQSPFVPAGGVDYLAGYIAWLKSQDPDNIVVSAGDLTGASPLLSSLFHEEPTIEAANRFGLEINAVGNHEFDKGREELLRFQHGGCSTLDANTCLGAQADTPVPFEGAKFQYLAANVYDTSTGKTIFPPYAIRTWHGVQVAFIGLTLKETPANSTASAVAGLRFADEATTINDLVRQLRAQGVQSFVVLLHQGGLQSAKGTLDINACVGDMEGSTLRSIVADLDDAVALVLSAHSHEAYVCQLPNRAGRNIPVTSASAFGRVLTDIDLTIDTKSKKIVAIAARNLVVDRTNPQIKPDAAIQSIVAHYNALAAPIQDRVVGSITAEIPKPVLPSGESRMGDLIADSELDATSSSATGAAVIAIMNEDGVRTGLPFASGAPNVPPGKVTFGELFAAQPFANTLVTLTLTGAQLHTLLEEQFKGCALGAPAGQTPPAASPATDRRLELSAGFAFAFSQSAPPCRKVDPASIQLHGVTLAPTASYRVTVNNFLADGGSDFFVLKEAANRLVGPTDLDATVAYFAKHPIIDPPTPNRITMLP
jgi:5'-nucleotidase